MLRLRNKERSTVNELVVILAKMLGYAVIMYISFYHPFIYAQAPLLGKGLLLFLGASLSVSVIRLALVTWYIRRNRLKSNIKDNFVIGIDSIVNVLNVIFLVLAFMIFLGVDPVKFLTSITIVAAAIALTFKDYITNMINGLIIMFSDRLSLGDHIKLQDQEGKILDITLVNVILQNEDNDMVLIPNSLVFTSMIVNQSKQYIRKLTVDFELDLLHGYTPQQLEDRLFNKIQEFSDNIIKNGFSVKTLEIKKDLARFKIQVLLKYNDRAREREIRRRLNTAILELVAPEHNPAGS
jgi:small-conductance mechanosensitive channel